MKEGWEHYDVEFEHHVEEKLTDKNGFVSFSRRTATASILKRIYVYLDGGNIKEGWAGQELQLPFTGLRASWADLKNLLAMLNMKVPRRCLQKSLLHGDLRRLMDLEKGTSLIFRPEYENNQ